VLHEKIEEQFLKSNDGRGRALCLVIRGMEKDAEASASRNQRRLLIAAESSPRQLPQSSIWGDPCSSIGAGSSGIVPLCNQRIALPHE
jgi:hypothetical protein